MSANVRARILAEIDAERARQDAKWGEQNHPDVLVVGKWRLVPSAERMADILVEEVAEVIEAATMAEHLRGSEHQHAEEDVDRELVQLAAVCVSWLEARARRRAGGAQ